jgi:hypothetical protein
MCFVIEFDMGVAVVVKMWHILRQFFEIIFVGYWLLIEVARKKATTVSFYYVGLVQS